MASPPRPRSVLPRGKGLTPKDLEVRELDGGRYVFAVVKQAGRPAAEVLAESLPGLVAGIKFDKSMRWNASPGVAFSRPLRWFVALLGETVIPFEYAGLTAGRIDPRPAPVQLAGDRHPVGGQVFRRSSRRTASCWMWKSARH